MTEPNSKPKRVRILNPFPGGSPFTSPKKAQRMAHIMRIAIYDEAAGTLTFTEEHIKNANKRLNEEWNEAQRRRMNSDR